MIDVTQQINAVRRRVGTPGARGGRGAHRDHQPVYDAPLEDVWDACTNAERIPRWFLPVSGDLRLGGRYQLEGNAGGTIERCDPPKSFVATWEYGGEVSWIEVRLTPEADDRTRLEIEHIAHVDDERWAEFGPGAVGIGWDRGVLGPGPAPGGGGEQPEPRGRRGLAGVRRGQRVHARSRASAGARRASPPAPTRPRPGPPRRAHRRLHRRAGGVDRRPAASSSAYRAPAARAPTALRSDGVRTDDTAVTERGRA